MKTTTLANDIGKGLMAGLAGTVAMTVSSTLEQKLRRRQASSAPAQAAAKLLGIETFEDSGARTRFGNIVHWGYGTGWGVARGVLSFVGVPPKLATAAHFAAIWGGAQVMLPVLDVAPPVTMWGGREIVIDVWHHTVYAVTTGVAYELLDGHGHA